MSKEIVIEARKGYGGQVKYYPMCNDGKTFARIAGTTTLTDRTIKGIKTLGYKVKVNMTF